MACALLGWCCFSLAKPVNVSFRSEMRLPVGQPGPEAHGRYLHSSELIGEISAYWLGVGHTDKSILLRLAWLGTDISQKDRKAFHWPITEVFVGPLSKGGSLFFLKLLSQFLCKESGECIEIILRTSTVQKGMMTQRACQCAQGAQFNWLKPGPGLYCPDVSYHMQL